MEKEQLKKIFIIAIIISFLISVFTITFAYFYTQAKGSKGVETESARLGLSLDVKRVTSEKTIGLLPLSDTDVKKAVEEKKYGSCIDSIGRGRCQVYEIKVTNTGNITEVLKGTLDLKPDNNSKFTNLKWMEIRSLNDATAFGKIHTINENGLKENYAMGARTSATFYVVIWISETGKIQNSEDKGSFSGTITFNTTAGVSSNATFAG